MILLSVCVSSSPVPEITWKRANGVPFPSKVKMKYSNAVLEIPSFQQDDTGGYECVAENKMGKNTATGRLAFYGTVYARYTTLAFTPTRRSELPVILNVHSRLWTVRESSSTWREATQTQGGQSQQLVHTLCIACRLKWPRSIISSTHNLLLTPFFCLFSHL